MYRVFRTFFVFALFVLISAGLGLSKQAVAQSDKPITLDHLAIEEWNGDWTRTGSSGVLNVVFNEDIASYIITNSDGEKIPLKARVLIEEEGEGDVVVTFAGTKGTWRIDRFQLHREGNREELRGRTLYRTRLKDPLKPAGTLVLRRTL